MLTRWNGFVTIGCGLQNWPEIACLLWFRARKWREIAVLLVPVRERLEIACGCSGVCRMEVARAGALHKTSTKTCFGKSGRKMKKMRNAV